MKKAGKRELPGFQASRNMTQLARTKLSPPYLTLDRNIKNK